MTITNVKAHTRGRPDPFQEVMEAKRPIFAKRWGVELVNDNDTRLNRPAEFVQGHGRQTLQQIAEQLMGLARLAAKIGRR